MSLRVLLADDQALVRAGLRLILEGAGFSVVGEAEDGVRAVEMARELEPDVCLFDVRMPKRDGVWATEQLAGRGVKAPMAVVVITTFDLDEYVHGALKAGARGFLLKDAGSELLSEAIRAAAAGDMLISPKITQRLLARFSRQPPPEPFEALSAREEEVLVLLARGQTNAEIATDLDVSLSTVKSHVANLMGKLDARNRVELAIYAFESGRV